MLMLRVALNQIHYHVFLYIKYKLSFVYPVLEIEIFLEFNEILTGLWEKRLASFANRATQSGTTSGMSLNRMIYCCAGQVHCPEALKTAHQTELWFYQ